MFHTMKTLTMVKLGSVTLVGNILSHMRVKVIFAIFTNYLTIRSTCSKWSKMI